MDTPTPDNAAREIDRYDMFVESNGYSTYVDYLPKANGDWVRYDDHAATVAALEAEVERLRSTLLRIESLLGPRVHLYDTTSDMALALEAATSTLTGARAK